MNNPLQQKRGTSLALIVIRVPALLHQALTKTTTNQTVYLYDSTDGKPLFLGAAGQEVHGKSQHNLPEIEYQSLKQNPPATPITELQMPIADRTWTMVILPTEGTYEPTLIYVVLGGTLIFCATIFLVVLFCRNMGRVANKLALETERRNAAAERAINEYIAHEVR